jgi:hypothetical protein
LFASDFPDASAGATVLDRVPAPPVDPAAFARTVKRQLPPEPEPAPPAPLPIIQLEENQALTQLERKTSQPPADALPEASVSELWANSPPPTPLPIPHKPGPPWRLIAGAVAVILLLAGASWAVFGRGDGRKAEAEPVEVKREQPKPEEPKPEPTPEPKPVEAKPVEKPEPRPEPKPEPKPVDAKPVEKKPEPKPAETKSAEAKPAAAKAASRKVVIEYDKDPVDADAPPEVKRARGLYLDGNKKLSGDANGAVALYQSSLKAYPGYVAAYRGMGLAFVQLKDTPKALASFKTYVKLAPGAKDAPLIKKVIEKLEKESGG